MDDSNEFMTLSTALETLQLVGFLRTDHRIHNAFIHLIGVLSVQATENETAQAAQKTVISSVQEVIAFDKQGRSLIEKYAPLLWALNSRQFAGWEKVAEELQKLEGID